MCEMEINPTLVSTVVDQTSLNVRMNKHVAALIWSIFIAGQHSPPPPDLILSFASLFCWESHVKGGQHPKLPVRCTLNLTVQQNQLFPIQIIGGDHI